MWENVIGRSLSFWRHYAPVLREYFPGQLDDVSSEQIHRAVNRVRPTFIRVEADECTYNLHIVIRFEIEVAIIEGDLAVADVPEAWNAKVRNTSGWTCPTMPGAVCRTSTGPTAPWGISPRMPWATYTPLNCSNVSSKMSRTSGTTLRRAGLHRCSTGFENTSTATDAAISPPSSSQTQRAVNPIPRRTCATSTASTQSFTTCKTWK